MNHRCIGEGCLICQAEIDRREFGEPAEDAGWEQGQDAYESYLDRMGEP